MEEGTVGPKLLPWNLFLTGGSNSSHHIFGRSPMSQGYSGEVQEGVILLQ